MDYNNHEYHSADPNVKQKIMKNWLDARKTSFQSKMNGVEDSGLKDVYRIILDLLEYLLVTDSNYSTSLDSAFSNLESQLTNFPSSAEVIDGHKKIIITFQQELQQKQDEIVSQLNCDHESQGRALLMSISAIFEDRLKTFEYYVNRLESKLTALKHDLEKSNLELGQKLDNLIEIGKDQRETLLTNSKKILSLEMSMKETIDRIGKAETTLSGIHSMNISSSVVIGIIATASIIFISNKLFK